MNNYTRDVYLICDLFGRVITRRTAYSEADAAHGYMRELEERGETTEAFYAIKRTDWVRWKTEQPYLVPDEDEPLHVDWAGRPKVT